MMIIDGNSKVGKVKVFGSEKELQLANDLENLKNRIAFELDAFGGDIILSKHPQEIMEKFKAMRKELGL